MSESYELLHDYLLKLNTKSIKNVSNKYIYIYKFVYLNIIDIKIVGYGYLKLRLLT